MPTLSQDEFLSKIELGFPTGFSDSIQAPFVFEERRLRVTHLSSRIVRDRFFRRLILQATACCDCQPATPSR